MGRAWWVFSFCFLYTCDPCLYQVLEGVNLVSQFAHVDVGAGYVVSVDQNCEVGEVLADWLHLLLPGLPHLHSVDNHVVLYGQVVPVARDLLFKGVVVKYDVYVSGLSFLSRFLLPVGLLGLVGFGVSCGLVL